MSAVEFQARRKLLAAHLEELLELEHLVESFQLDPRNAGSLRLVDLFELRKEIHRISCRLVAVQLTIEEMGGEE